MHSLGLYILRRGNQLTNFPSEPTVLDDWEQNRVYDIEYSLIEQRRLFYVSVTRSKAACIISHATKYTGAPAQALAQKATAYLTRSEFLNEMRVVSTNKEGGFTPEEVQRIMADINNL